MQFIRVRECCNSHSIVNWDTVIMGCWSTCKYGLMVYFRDLEKSLFLRLGFWCKRRRELLMVTVRTRITCQADCFSGSLFLLSFFIFFYGFLSVCPWCGRLILSFLYSVFIPLLFLFCLCVAVAVSIFVCLYYLCTRSSVKNDLVSLFLFCLDVCFFMLLFDASIQTNFSCAGYFHCIQSNFSSYVFWRAWKKILKCKENYLFVITMYPD